MARAVNVGVVGAGRIGRLHAEHLAHRVPGAALRAVADPRREAAEACARELGVPAAYDDPRRVLDDPEIEAVAVCSSTDTHAELIVQAAAAGKHIFCEKPIDLDLARIGQALDAVARAGVKLQVGFNRRFDPGFRRAREAVAAGQLGRLHLLRITSRDPQPPSPAYVRVSGGIFLDMTIHDFDMARFLAGDEAAEIYAAGSVLVDPEIGRAGDVDTAVVSLRFSGGALGAIDNSRRAVYGYDQRVEVFGEHGMVSVGNSAPHAAVLSDARGAHAPLPHFFFVERYAESYVAEMRSFVDCIARDSVPVVTGEDGRIPVVMGLAALRSLRENRPVRLSEIHGAREA